MNINTIVFICLGVVGFAAMVLYFDILHYRKRLKEEEGERQYYEEKYHAEWTSGREWGEEKNKEIAALRDRASLFSRRITILSGLIRDAKIDRKEKSKIPLISIFHPSEGKVCVVDNKGFKTVEEFVHFIDDLYLTASKKAYVDLTPKEKTVLVMVAKWIREEPASNPLPTENDSK